MRRKNYSEYFTKNVTGAEHDFVMEVLKEEEVK